MQELGMAFNLQKIDNVNYYTNVAAISGDASSTVTLKSWCLPMGQTMEAFISLNEVAAINGGNLTVLPYVSAIWIE